MKVVLTFSIQQQIIRKIPLEYWIKKCIKNEIKMAIIKKISKNKMQNIKNH